MKRLPIFLLSTLFLTTTTAYGQLELDANGRVGIGTAPSTAFTLNVRANGLSNALNVLSNSTGSSRYGIQTRAIGGTSAIGIQARADNATTTYGILGVAVGGTTNYAGYFSGDVAVTGSCCAPPSDEKLKEGVTNLIGSDVIARLMQLSPISYRYKTDEFRSMNLSSGIKYGLSAQATEKVFPEFVRNHVHPPELDAEGRQISDPISYKGIVYTELIPLLLSAIQEQQKRIEALETALNANGIEVGR